MIEGDVTRADGLLVVRLPLLNFDPKGRGAFPKKPPCRSGVCYGGFDRMPWFDVDEALIAGVLPPQLSQMRKQIRESKRAGLGIELCPDLEAAKALLAFSNGNEPANELIAIRTREPDRATGIRLNHDAVSWSGFDVVLFGGWSVLREWVFEGIGVPPQTLALVNRHGLLSEQWMIDEIAAGYEAAVRRGEAEERPDASYEIVGIEVGKVQWRE